MFLKEFFNSRISNISKIYKLAELLFLISIFFLCSTIAISGLLLLVSLIFGSILKTRKKNQFKNPWECSFLICGILITINALLHKFIIPNNFQEIWDPNLSIIGIANWIPLFWIFWACQPFLDSPKKRKRFAIILLAGTLPLLLTGFGQYFLDWTGPFKALNGLIVWYQRPIDGGLTGLFNNQNYAGSWFNLVLPFCLALIFKRSNNFLKKSLSISFLLSISFSIFLTYSRNAWLGMLLALPLFLGKDAIIYIILGFAFLIFLISPIFSGAFQSNILQIIPKIIVDQFSPDAFKDLDSTRLDLIVSAIEMIKTSPIVGIGAGSFTPIYQLETNLYRGHSHNLFTELALSYGVPVTLIFAISIISILIISYNMIFLNKYRNKDINYIDRAFWVAVFLFFISQLADIQYFEGRISILVWILLASLKNIIEEDKFKKRIPKKIISNEKDYSF